MQFFFVYTLAQRLLLCTLKNQITRAVLHCDPREIVNQSLCLVYEEQQLTYTGFAFLRIQNCKVEPTTAVADTSRPCVVEVSSDDDMAVDSPLKQSIRKRQRISSVIFCSTEITEQRLK